MLAPIAILIRFYRRAGRTLRRLSIPLWLRDALAFVGRYLNVVSWALTVFYCTFYPTHFYRRLHSIVNTRRRRHVLRPFPYALGLLAAINIFRTFGWRSGEVTDGQTFWEFNLTIVIGAVLSPVAFVLLTVIVIILTMVTNFGLRALPGEKPHPGPPIAINWTLLRLLTRRRFWQGYSFGLLPPGLLYYSTYWLVAFPAAVFLFIVATGIVFAIFDGLFRPDSNLHSAVNFLMMLFVYLIALGCVYWILYRPLLFAVLAPSELARRRSPLPELIGDDGSGLREE